MEELIKQAFQSGNVIGPLVQRGMFHLIGPHGEIIPPQVWDKIIEPDWQITMVMWPPEWKDNSGPIQPSRRSTRPPLTGRRAGSATGNPAPPPDWHGAAPEPPGSSSIPTP